MTILIVDDTEANLAVLGFLLERSGYRVDTATNGTEALAKARQNPPDLVISDILMPGMDGFTLCREMKQDARLNSVAFVFYTSTYTDKRDRDFALSLGAQGFMVKPEEPQVILQTIQNILAQPRQPPAPPVAPNTPELSPPAPPTPPELEVAYLRKHNETLVRKLESKLGQLEQANRRLEHDIARRNQAETELRDSREQLRALLARLQTLREDERSHIAREVHDQLGQQLTGLRMDLQWVERHCEEWPDPHTNQILDRIVEAIALVDSTIKSVQRIATELRPDVLDHLGLAAALRAEITRFQQRTNIRCQIHTLGEDRPLPREITTVVFRVFQEALTNIARHARATEVSVHYECTEPQVTLEVRDNGIGIPANTVTNARSLGLLGMQERVRPLGGQVSVQGAPDHGTLVRLSVPTRSILHLGI